MNTVTVINHTNKTFSKLTNIRYVDFKHNFNDTIEIHQNKDAFIPTDYREHKPYIFPAESLNQNKPTI